VLLQTIVAGLLSRPHMLTPFSPQILLIIYSRGERCLHKSAQEEQNPFGDPPPLPLSLSCTSLQSRKSSLEEGLREQDIETFF